MESKVLLVYPETPPTFWSFRYALPFIGKKAAHPPLGLLTVAALLPKNFEVSLVDLNVTPLTDAAIAQADMVFVSAMIVQQKSFAEVVRRCQQHGKPVVAGGPYPTNCYERISGVTHFVLNEAETTLPQFLQDYQAGKAKPLYLDSTKPDITLTPPPRLELINIKDYSTMALQYSRGCPYACEFCDIIEMFGRTPRTKTPAQFLRELELLYQTGYRGSLFVVDDNFIGNRKNVRGLLPPLAEWQARNDYPFALFTEATIDLAEDTELMDLMVRAGFNMVFLGIETPVAETLVLAHKRQNTKSDLLASVRRIQRRGMEVSSGFIVGFDNDPADIFDRQIHFIQNSGIPTAMVGLLTALPKTPLYRRLKGENRLLEDSAGNNTHDLRLNFMPKMDLQKLMAGYKRVLAEIYRPEHYFDRCLHYLKTLRPHRTSARRITFTELRAFIASLVIQGFSAYGWQYWKFMVRAFFLKPRLLAESVALAIKGHHFFKITRGVLAADRFKQRLEELTHILHRKTEKTSPWEIEQKLAELKEYRDRVLREVRREYRRLHADYQVYVEDALASFEATINELIMNVAVGIPQTVPSRSAGAAR
jgi:radical SAM superfamily enzyme YgiQ (UPF0313 family)